MAPTPSTPRKRQNISANQATITSFFKPSSEATPPLPPAIQSGLLSVGMRVRKSVPEGYKSGTYAFNKHLPNVLVPTSLDYDYMPSSQESTSSVDSTQMPSPSKKRPFDHNQEVVQELKIETLPQPPVSITSWARSVKIPTGAGGKEKKRGFHAAIERKDVTMGEGVEDFSEAEFLRPIDKVEE